MFIACNLIGVEKFRLNDGDERTRDYVNKRWDGMKMHPAYVTEFVAITRYSAGMRRQTLMAGVKGSDKLEDIGSLGIIPNHNLMSSDYFMFVWFDYLEKYKYLWADVDYNNLQQSCMYPKYKELDGRVH